MNRGKWLAASLFLSLGVNLFLLGVLSNRFLKGSTETTQEQPVSSKSTNTEPKRHRKKQQAGLEIQGSLKRRPSKNRPDSHQVLRRMVRLMGGPNDPRVKALKLDTRQDFKKRRLEIEHARSKVQRALLANPFDQKELELAMEELHERASDVQRRAQKKIASLAAQLTTKEREKFQETLKRRNERKLKQEGKPRRRPSPP